MKDINLLPEEVKAPIMQVKKSSMSISPKFVIVALFVLIIAIATLWLPKLYVTSIEARVEAVNQELESVKYNELKTVKDRVQMVENTISQKKKIINFIDSENYPVSQFLQSIIQSVPKGVDIYSISYQSKSLRISGKQQSYRAADEFISNLSRLGFMSSSENLQTISLDELGKSFYFDYTFSVGRKAGK
ncbi:MAG: PilN domain-containing protein [Clostridia bacterium]|nr:PilN domain-containing protein [Clostridia bacterium]